MAYTEMIGSKSGGGEIKGNTVVEYIDVSPTTETLLKTIEIPNCSFVEVNV